MEPLIRNISDTARWVAIYRAQESERPDAVFRDPFARRLAGERGQQIADALEFTTRNSWSFVARTFLFDEIVMRYVRQGYDMVVNLAAGLDARPYRMSLPNSLKWIEVDLPGILDYKESILQNETPRCQLERMRVDLASKEARVSLFKKLNNDCSQALILSEGLIGYLTEEQSGALAKDLSDQVHFRHWAFDLLSPGLLKMIQKEMGNYLDEANAPLQFAPAEGEVFFSHYGWILVESKSKLKTAAILNRLSKEMLVYANYPEPEGPKGDFPWTGVCLFENMNQPA